MAIRHLPTFARANFVLTLPSLQEISAPLPIIAHASDELNFLSRGASHGQFKPALRGRECGGATFAYLVETLAVTFNDCNR
jgi:hypothetical protein